MRTSVNFFGLIEAIHVSATNTHPPELHSLQEVIHTLRNVCAGNHGNKVSIGAIVDALGARSFAPAVLTIGLIGITPVDSIPTLPTTFGVIILLTVGQMLIGRQSLWLPGIITNRAVSADGLNKALLKLEPCARRADGWVGMRFTVFTHGPFLVAIAGFCAVLAALMPILELVPLVSTLPSLAFTVFGIALLLHDGLAALVGFALSAVSLALIFELARVPF